MKKCIALLVVLLIACAPALGETMLVRLSAECYNTNHVGMDWLGSFFIGDLEVTDGSIIDLKSGTYVFYSEILDNDASPDLGTAETEFKVLKTDLRNGFMVEQGLVVVESKGRYAGYGADWYIRYELIPVSSDSVFILY